MVTFEITEDYIELIGLLKVLGIAETGGQAKMIVDAGLVKRNGEVEFRKRAKLVDKDIIEIDDIKITLSRTDV